MTGNRLLGLDLGERWVGVAVSDESGVMVFPRKPWHVASIQEIITHITEFVSEHTITGIIVGLPVSLSGRETAQTESIRSMLAEITKSVAIPITTYDERLSSKLADTLLRNTSDKDVQHSIAAQKMLEDYIQQNGLNV